MAFEPNYEKLVSSFRKKLGATQAVIECRLPVAEGRPMGILCANAKANIEGSEVANNEISFRGFANLQVIYLDENKIPQALDYSAEFKDKIVGVVGGYANLLPIVVANVIDVKTLIEANAIKVTAIIEVNVDGVITEDTNALVSVGGNSTFTKNELITYQTLEDTPTEKFEIIQDVEIKDSVNKVLSVCPSVFIESVEPKDKYLILKGGINLDICYLSEGETPLIRTLAGNFDFTQEIAGENITPESVVQNNIQVMVNEMKITTSIDVETAVINCVVPVMYRGFVFNQKEMETVTDVFNVNNFLQTSYQSVETLKPFASMDYVEKIDGSATLEDSMPFMDEVLGNCCNHITLANARIMDNRLLLEGVANTTVIYFNKEDNATISYEVEMPFSLLLNANDIPNDFQPVINIGIGEVVAKGKRGKEIEINAKLFIYADFYTGLKECVINEASEGEEKPYDDLVLSIYIVKDGDTIWDIAKEMNVSPDMILEQNPDLELPLKAGTKIVIYKQRLIEF